LTSDRRYVTTEASGASGADVQPVIDAVDPHFRDGADADADADQRHASRCPRSRRGKDGVANVVETRLDQDAARADRLRIFGDERSLLRE
jgi:hypothetical protein